MYDELIKRLKELASIPKHCENVADCDQCSKEDICLSFTNERIIETATKAADAIEHMRPVVRGKWKHGVCQICFFDWFKVAPLASIPNFCPNCGADMREEK